MRISDWSSDVCSSDLALDGDRAAQAIEGQPPGKVVRGGALAINQQIGLVAPDQEIEQHFALRRQQRRPHRQVARHIIGDESLQEAAAILTRQAAKDTSVEVAVGHALTIGVASWDIHRLPLEKAVWGGAERPIWHEPQRIFT